MKVLFNEEKISLIVTLDQKFQVPQHIYTYALENRLIEKEEFHFTPITFTQGKIILNQFQNLNLSDLQQKAVRLHILEKAQNTKWDIAPDNKFYHLKKKYIFPNKTVIKESIVEKIESDALKQFIEYTNTLLTLNLESFGHVTLFTKSDDIEEKNPGIGINSEEEFNSLIIKEL